MDQKTAKARPIDGPCCIAICDASALRYGREAQPGRRVGRLAVRRSAVGKAGRRAGRQGERLDLSATATRTGQHPAPAGAQHGPAPGTRHRHRTRTATAQPRGTRHRHRGRGRGRGRSRSVSATGKCRTSGTYGTVIRFRRFRRFRFCGGKRYKDQSSHTFPRTHSVSSCRTCQGRVQEQE